MVISADKVDAYLRGKGIAPRMTDAQWMPVIEALKPFFTNGRWYRVKLLHQREDPLGRYSSLFPESIPTPYRFIDYIEFAAGDTTPDSEVLSALKLHSIPFTMTPSRNGPDEVDVVTIVRVGPRPQ
jgi:hypothetical protein